MCLLHTHIHVCVKDVHVHIVYVHVHVSVSGEEVVCEEMGCGGDEGIWG